MDPHTRKGRGKVRRVHTRIFGWGQVRWSDKDTEQAHDMHGAGAALENRKDSHRTRMGHAWGMHGDMHGAGAGHEWKGQA
eukprot:357975-Chlamydomonas_euryale.AAC.1